MTFRCSNTSLGICASILVMRFMSTLGLRIDEEPERIIVVTTGVKGL